MNDENQKNKERFYRSWEMGSCFGPKKIFDDITNKSTSIYESNRIYIDTCCLSPMTYTLRCTNAVGPFGWGKSFIEIEGQRYCDDFVGNKGFRKVLIEGKQQTELQISIISKLINKYYHIQNVQSIWFINYQEIKYQGD